jgi:hypothetical protein
MSGASRAHAIAALGALALAALGPAVAAATSYRWVDADGVVHYSDRPPAGDPAAGPASRPGGAQRPDAESPSPLDAWSPRGGPRGPSPAEQMAQELIDRSGLDVALGRISEAGRHALDTTHWRIRHDPRARAAVAEAFEPHELRRAAARHLARRLDRSRGEAALAWLRSPLARRLLEMENAAAGADAAEARSKFVDALPVAPPPPARLALMHRLDRALELSASALELIEAMEDTVTRATGPLIGRRPGRRDHAHRAWRDERARMQAMASALFTYRTLPDAELARYVAFAESPTGRWLAAMQRGALLAALGVDDPPALATR